MNLLGHLVIIQNMPRKTRYKTSEFTQSFENSKVINWNEISILLTGESQVIRGNFVPLKYHGELVKLMVFVTRWANKNKHPDYYHPKETVIIGNTVKPRQKIFKKAKQFTELSKIPEGSVKIQKGIYQKDNLFYTDRFNINTGPDIKEWYSLEKAQKYMSESRP